MQLQRQLSVLLCCFLLPKTAQGKLDHEMTLLLINCYLPSGNSPEAQARRCSALEALCQAKALPPKYVVAGGDWNLVERECDSCGQGHFASTPEMLRVFQRVTSGSDRASCPTTGPQDWPRELEGNLPSSQGSYLESKYAADCAVLAFQGLRLRYEASC